MFICDLLFLQYVFTFTAGKIAISIAHQRNTLRNPKTSSSSYLELELFFFVKKLNSILRPSPFKIEIRFIFKWPELENISWAYFVSHRHCDCAAHTERNSEEGVKNIGQKYNGQ